MWLSARNSHCATVSRLLSWRWCVGLVDGMPVGSRLGWMSLSLGTAHGGGVLCELIFMISAQ